MIDFTNKFEIESSLKKLRADSLPNWGSMNAQQMIEHLEFTIQFSNGKLIEKLYNSKEKADYFKNYIIYTDAELPKGFKAPMLGDELPVLKHLSIEISIVKLLDELNDFDYFFTNNPEVKPIHPSFGELTYKEWITFHSKHFTHHFKQFNLN